MNPNQPIEVLHATGRRNHLVSGPEGARIHPNSGQDRPHLLAEGRPSWFSQGQERDLQSDSTTERGSSESSGYPADGCGVEGCETCGMLNSWAEFEPQFLSSTEIKAWKPKLTDKRLR